MTPLVDVMLVLLIIFIITVPVLTHSVKIDLPQAASNENKIEPKSIIVSITNDAEVYWNDELVSSDELQRRLTFSADQSPQPELQLRGARHVQYEVVVQVMSAAQQAGILKLGFVTRL